MVVRELPSSLEKRLLYFLSHRRILEVDVENFLISFSEGIGDHLFVHEVGLVATAKRRTHVSTVSTLAHAIRRVPFFPVRKDKLGQRHACRAGCRACFLARPW
jgi:hypothetical protein